VTLSFSNILVSGFVKACGVSCVENRSLLNFRYCVAWYPIYRIPDGKFQAAFLTYHSLGHWIHQSSSADGAVVLPVIGLQSYNAKVKD